MTDPNSVAIIAIGTELTRGEIANTNGAWLAERLTSLGMDVVCLETVADDKQAIVDCLNRWSERCRLVLVTGGLGPTTDDFTTSTVASFLGVELERDDGVVADLKTRIAALGLDPQLLESNLSQADFPKGSTKLPNAQGTAPGFQVEYGDCLIACMPGVPREMKPMFESSVEPWVRSQVKGGESLIRLRCFGSPESSLNDKLDGIEREFDVTIGYRAHYPEVQIKILSRDSNREKAESKTFAAAAVARSRLKHAIYAEGDVDMPRAVAQLLRDNNLTLSLAESCTGGLVASLLTREPASDYFLGGVVSYANQVKADLLGVPLSILEKEGAVSEAVVQLMAEEIRSRTNSDLALALTGIAGPTGSTDTKPLGLVYLAVADKYGTVVKELKLHHRDRQRVQLYAAWAGLDLIRHGLRAL